MSVTAKHADVELKDERSKPHGKIQTGQPAHHSRDQFQWEHLVDRDLSENHSVISLNTRQASYLRRCFGFPQEISRLFHEVLHSDHASGRCREAAKGARDGAFHSRAEFLSHEGRTSFDTSTNDQWSKNEHHDQIEWTRRIDLFHEFVRGSKHCEERLKQTSSCRNHQSEKSKNH